MCQEKNAATDLNSVERDSREMGMLGNYKQNEAYKIDH